MSDNDLLIGGPDQPKAPQGSSGIQVPSDLVQISVFGVYADDTAVEQKLSLRLPRGVAHDQAALFVWDNVSKIGGITTVGTAGEYNFFPLALFKRVTLKFGTVVGVSL